MSVIFNTLTEAAIRTTGVVASTSPYTCTFWLKIDALPGTGLRYVPFITADSIATPTQFVMLATDVDTLTLKLRGDNGAGGTFTSTGFTLTAGQWYGCCYARTGNTHRIYLKIPNSGGFANTQTLNITGATFNEVQIGDDGSGDTNLEIGYFREWDQELTILEQRGEWNSTVANETVDLVTDCPLTADLLDDSGNGHDFTAVGSLTFDAAAPGLLANGAPSVATTIGTLPQSLSQTLSADGYAFRAWYAWTAEADGLVSVWGYRDNKDIPGIFTSLYIETPAPALNNHFIGPTDENKPIQFAATMGHEYLLYFEPEDDVEPFDLLIELEFHVTESAPIGSIAVNDDTGGLPLILLSGIGGDDYHVLTYVNDIVSGEAGDVLNDGTVFLHDRFFAPNGQGVIYDNQLNEVTSITPLLLSSTGGVIRTCQGTQRWWMCYVESSIRKARSVDPDGTLGTGHTLTGYATVQSIAANNDETILYHSGINVGERAVKRWDLVNDVALSDLAAELSGYRVIDILVQSDDTIIYSLVDGTGTPDIKVKRVQPDGTVLNTYEFGSAFAFFLGTFPRLAYAIDEPDSFWIWTHPDQGTDNGLSRFQEVQCSDGTILNQIDQVEFYIGAYVPDVSGLIDPVVFFGNSPSCPFWLTRVAIADTGGTIRVVKVTVPSSDSTEFDFVAGGGLSPTDFSLSHGELQIYTDVTAGSGYSVEETPNVDYTTTVEVSNDSPNDNITVADGETVTVTFTNTATSEGTGTIQVVKVTLPESDTTAFDFTAGGGLDPVEFSLSGGEDQTYTDVPVGSGYSVVETVNTAYQTTIDVSNGSPHTNITVAENETVIVTFTNSSTIGPGFNTRAVKRRWLRRSPIYSKENARVRYKMFQLDCEVGTGTNAEPGMDPQVYLSYSDDWGETWSFVIPRAMGPLGQYDVQLQWWQLGIGRNRVFEVYGSDPVKVALLDGFARVEPGTD